MNAEASDILWFIFIGAMFLMMFRKGGCCGGHKMKHQSHEENKDITKK